MNKYSSFLPLLTVAMCGVFASCSQDALVMQEPSEHDSASPQKIEFYLDMKTRGEDVTLQNLDTIYVFGTYKDADGKRHSCFSTSEYEFGFVPFIRRVKKDPGQYTYDIPEDHYYRPDTDIYWDDEWAETCQFFALNVKPNTPLYGEYNGEKFADSDIEKSYARMNMDEGQDIFSSITFDQTPLVKDEIDVIYANNGGATKAGSRFGIPLDFYHVFTAFDIKFRQSPEISDYIVKVYAADIVQKSVADYWFDLEDNVLRHYTHGGNEEGHIITCPDGNYLEVSDKPQRLNDIKPYAYLVPSNMYSPTTNNDLFRYKWNLSGVNTEPQLFLKLYLTVEDKSGNVVYPTADDLNNDYRNKNNVSSKAAEKTDYEFWDKIGVSYISLGKDQTHFYRGNRYSVTVDLSFGVGYFSPTDPTGSVSDTDGKEGGGRPVLNRPLGANVWIKDYDDSDSNSITVVPNSSNQSN